MNTFGKLLLLVLVVLSVGEIWRYRHSPMAEDKSAAQAISNLFEARRQEAVRPETTIYRDKNGKIIRKHEYEMMVGYDSAQERDLTNHDECTKMQGLERSGCDRYVSEKRIPPHIDQGDYSIDKTTAQCEAEVNTHFDARIQDLRELGFTAGQSSMIDVSKARYEEREQCQLYDASAAYRPRTTP